MKENTQSISSTAISEIERTLARYREKNAPVDLKAIVLDDNTTIITTHSTDEIEQIVVIPSDRTGAIIVDL